MPNVSIHLEHLLVFVGVLLPAWTFIYTRWVLDKRYERRDK